MSFLFLAPHRQETYFLSLKHEKQEIKLPNVGALRGGGLESEARGLESCRIWGGATARLNIFYTAHPTYILIAQIASRRSEMTSTLQKHTCLGLSLLSQSLHQGQVLPCSTGHDVGCCRLHMVRCDPLEDVHLLPLTQLAFGLHELFAKLHSHTSLCTQLTHAQQFGLCEPPQGRQPASQGRGVVL